MTTSPAVTSGLQTASSTKFTSTCIDHPDCQLLLQQFPICNASNAVMNICPKTCGSCAMTTTPSTCMDKSEDCQILIAHFHVCTDIEFSLEKCQKSCSLCNYHTTTMSNRETPMLFTSPNRETPVTSTSPNRETPVPSTVPNRETPPQILQY